MDMVEDWAGLYKFGRLALLALCLGGIAAFLLFTRRGQEIEALGRQPLEDEDPR